MRVVTFSEARNNLKYVLEQASNDADYTIITRRGKKAAVVLSWDAFNSYLETVHLLSTKSS